MTGTSENDGRRPEASVTGTSENDGRRATTSTRAETGGDAPAVRRPRGRFYFFVTLMTFDPSPLIPASPAHWAT